MMSVTVSIPLRRVGGRGAFELRLELGEAGANVSAVQQHSTAAALLGYMDEKARSDQELSQERSQHLRYRQDEAPGDEALAGEEDRESVRAAELMGRRVRDIGDEYMAQMYRDPRTSSFIENIVRVDGDSASSAQTAFTHFCEVVNVILQCDECGAAQVITVGRVAALFSYCYHLCKVFILRKGIMGVVKFLGQLLSYLIRSLHQSNFYALLTSQGGWGHLLKQTSFLRLMFPVIIGGVLLLGFITLRHQLCIQ